MAVRTAGADARHHAHSNLPPAPRSPKGHRENESVGGMVGSPVISFARSWHQFGSARIRVIRVKAFALQYFRLKRLKEFGCNVYRTSHNPPTPELLDACDRPGMIVIHERRRRNQVDRKCRWVEVRDGCRADAAPHAASERAVMEIIVIWPPSCREYALLIRGVSKT
jgi:hypothetical protein